MTLRSLKGIHPPLSHVLQEPQAHYHHAEERAVDVDVEAFLAVASLPQDVQHAVQVVHGALHSGATVDIYDGRPPRIGRQLHAEMLVVHLPRL